MRVISHRRHSQLSDMVTFFHGQIQERFLPSSISSSAYHFSSTRRASLSIRTSNMLHIHHRKLIEIATVFIISWVLWTFLIHRFEAAQGWSYFDALYFTVITTATIGFGDLVPHSVAGKLLTMGYAVFYVPLFLYAMNIVFQANFQKIRKEDELLEENLRHTEADVTRIIEDEYVDLPIKTRRSPKK